MIKCTFCYSMNVDNTIFCDGCGTFLLDVDDPETDELKKKAEKSKIGSATGTLQMPSGNGLEPINVRLKIENGAREIEARLDRSLHMGRLDPLSDNYPEIDLTEVGGIEKGVSRRHAKLLSQNEDLIIEDLGSINGTFINGQKLAPYSAEVVQDGDLVHLGELLIQVNIHLP
ncbi:MAG: FHA domain-containing protein [Chloroflexota bacterium]